VGVVACRVRQAVTEGEVVGEAADVRVRSGDFLVTEGSEGEGSPTMMSSRNRWLSSRSYTASGTE
jgi:hypothetical protein